MSNECNEICTTTTSAAESSSKESSNGFEKDVPSGGCSPAPSNCSFISEQEVHEDSIADSETSSRSSLDGSFLSKESSSEGMEKFRVRKHARKLSSSSSDSEGSSELTLGGGSVDGDEPVVRKPSKTKVIESSLPIARRVDTPRGRIANIRRESDCSLNNEVEHERLVKTAQQVACGFDDITIQSSSTEMRRRVPSITSVGEPISIVTNVFLPHSCSPSPTRVAEMHKQCYSPSTHQMVRPNMPYSTTPSPTQSPTRQQLLRSLSPITTKTTLKRRYTGGVEEVESKRSCGSGPLSGVYVRNSTSPLVTDRSFSSGVTQEFAQPSSMNVNWCAPSVGNRRYSTLENILERRNSVESVTDEQKTTDEVTDVLPEVDALQSNVTSDQSIESKDCDMCEDECSCERKSSSEESHAEQSVSCPYEPFLRST